MGSKRQKMDIPELSKEDFDYYECPVCFQIPRENIYQCTNGHHMCDDCSKKFIKCPTCQSVGVRCRARLAERLLDNHKFPCSWSERGCEETMKRGELSAHEDQCDQNPDIIKFCTLFRRGKRCQFKFTSKWLNEPENCTDFMNHVPFCLGPCRSASLIKYGGVNLTTVPLEDVLSLNLPPETPVHHVFMPMLYQMNLQYQTKVDIFFFLPLLNVDKLGTKFLSFVLVQLTPETTPLTVKFTINGVPNSGMISNWGTNSFPAQKWTQKVINLRKFMEMVGASPKMEEPEVPMPFSFPVTFLSEYYVDKDDKQFAVEYTLEQAS